MRWFPSQEVAINFNWVYICGMCIKKVLVQLRGNEEINHHEESCFQLILTFYPLLGHRSLKKILKRHDDFG